MTDATEKQLYEDYMTARTALGMEGIVPMKDLLSAERMDEAVRSVSEHLVQVVAATDQAGNQAADGQRVEEIAHAAQTNGGSVAQVANAAQELQVLSASLETSVSRFRL